MDFIIKYEYNLQPTLESLMSHEGLPEKEASRLIIK